MPRVVVLRAAPDRKLWLRRGGGPIGWEWTDALDDAAKFGTRQEALDAVGEMHDVNIHAAPAPDVTLTLSANDHRVLMTILDAAKERHAKTRGRQALIEMVREAGAD